MSDTKRLPRTYAWDVAMLEMAFVISRMSKDPRTKVGAVIVSPDKYQLAVGWNGFPSRFPDYAHIWHNRDDPQRLMKYDLVIHAEENALLNCHTRPEGWTLYCTHLPCVHCAARVVQAGITKVVYNLIPDTASLRCQQSNYIFSEAGVVVEQMELPCPTPSSSPSSEKGSSSIASS